jgi:hypothetical protein
MDTKFTWATDSIVTRVLDSAIVNIREYYAAVERRHTDTGKVEVFAAVCKLHVSRTEFGYKDMDESVGPAISNCPRRILVLLTEPYNVYAQDWRDACWAKIKRREALPVISAGTELRFSPPIQFSNGATMESLKVRAARGQSVKCSDAEGSGLYRFTRKFLESKFADQAVSIQRPDFGAV